MHVAKPQPDWLKDLAEAEGLRRERAFAAMMQAWHVPIYSYLRTMLNEHDDAADATQETFIQVVRSINAFRGEAKFSTWLYTIARRKGLDALRSRKQRSLRNAHPDASDWEERLEADPFFDGDDAERQLHAALQLLPARQREVFTLRYFQEMAYADIAELTGTSEGAAKASYFHAKNKVQSHLISSTD
jgi:RNA polymerase sigma-70 factor (ECF subfamily)